MNTLAELPLADLAKLYQQHLQQNLSALDPTNSSTLGSEITSKASILAIASSTRQWCVEQEISKKLTWLVHHLGAYFAEQDPQPEQSGLLSPALTYKHWVVEPRDLTALGATVLTRAPRSNLFLDAPTGIRQYSSPANPLVPLVLGGYKRYRGIPYSRWNLNELHRWESPELCALAGLYAPSLTPAELLELRNTAQTPKSGKRAGVAGNPATTATLWHLADTPLGCYPKLAQHLLLQTWCAHPTNRDPYSVGSLECWDTQTPPLTGTSPFSTTWQYSIPQP